MEIAPVLPNTWLLHSHSHHQQAFCNFKYHKYASSVEVNSTAVTVQGPPVQKPKWKSQDNNGNSLKRALDQPGINLDSNTCISLLQRCNNISELKQVHACMVMNGLDSNMFFGTKLVRMYVMWNSIENARLVFDKIYKRDGFLWNMMIRGYAKKGLCDEVLTLYYQMRRSGVQPNEFTFLFAITACASLSALQEGMGIHGLIVRSGFESDVFLGSALIHMYVKCGNIEKARHVFDKMSTRDMVSWSAMIAACAQSGRANEALALFIQMQLEDMKADSVTMVSVLQACANLAALEQGKSIHGYIIRRGFELEVFVVDSLINLYAKCGNVKVARRLFNRMQKPNVVSWSAMIAGYAQDGHANEALELFSQMQLTELKPDSVTMVCVVQACARLAALQQGKRIHSYIIRRGFETDVFVGNSLIDMYAKCGRIEIARQLFDNMPKRDVVSWNTLIASYSRHRHGNEALSLFDQMQQADVKPNSITMVSVLSACANLGTLQQGRCIHDYIIRSGFESDASVGTALVAMYFKCGSIENARQLFDKTSDRDVVLWNAMISGYSQNGHANEALTLFHRMHI